MNERCKAREKDFFEEKKRLEGRVYDLLGDLNLRTKQRDEGREMYFVKEEEVIKHRQVEVELKGKLLDKEEVTQNLHARINELSRQ